MLISNSIRYLEIETMEEAQKAKYYLKEMYEVWPKTFVEKIDVKCRGLWIILHYISLKAEGVCAGDISKEFNLSTARIAVVLKTLAKKELIETSTSETDRRKVVIKITDKGKQRLKKGEDDLVEFMKILLNKIGEDDIKEFIRIFSKINSVLECTKEN